jgi:hypothetical protein
MPATWSVINGAMTLPDFRPEKRAIVAAVISVAATYAYFLLFAQFGFLKALQVIAGEEQEVIKVVLGLMGFAGIGGSVMAGWLFTAARSKRTLVTGFILSAVAAAASVKVEAREIYYLIALLVGLGTGLTTVTLASLLRRTVGGQWLGRVIGLGTGLAYGFCNLPAVFDSTPAAQAWVSVVIAGVGALAAVGLSSRLSEAVPTGFDYSKVGVGLWVVLFSALVCFDSGAFYIIQHTPSLKNDTWVGSWRLGFNAGVHLVAAVTAGYALDRQWFGRTLFVAATVLLVASLMMGQRHPSLPGAGLWYVAAVSVYSVAFVFYAAYSARPAVAVITYAVAGWIGSAAGIAIAEGRHVVPVWFTAAAGVVIFTVLAIRLTCAKK